MLRPVIKIAKETPLTGRVINSIDNSHLDQNAPSMQFLLNSLKAKQLLINNDFQVNQRGKSLYDDFGYTLDGWHFYGIVGDGTTKPKIEVKDKGIKITNTDYNWCSIQQVVPDHLRGKTVTICFSVKDLQSNQLASINYPMNVRMCYGNTTGEVTSQNSYGIKAIYDDGIYSVTIDVPQNATHSRLKLAFMIGGSATIERVDMFEGAIAYQHRKDYTKSLIECKKFLKEIEINKSGYVAGSIPVKGTINFCVEMDAIPSFVITSIGTRQNVASVGIEVNNKRLIYTITTSTAGHFTLEGYKLIVSCEQL